MTYNLCKNSNNLKETFYLEHAGSLQLSICVLISRNSIVDDEKKLINQTNSLDTKLFRLYEMLLSLQ